MVAASVVEGDYGAARDQDRGGKIKAEETLGGEQEANEQSEEYVYKCCPGGKIKAEETLEGEQEANERSQKYIYKCCGLVRLGRFVLGWL